MPATMDLVWQVFLDFEAPDYGDEGIETFRNFIHDQLAISKLDVYAAFDKEEIVGVIGTRNHGRHIALFFVQGKRHRQGIGRRLFEFILKDKACGEMTVNSSPYAVEVYRRLGFKDTDIEQSKDGIRFTPMKYLHQPTL